MDNLDKYFNPETPAATHPKIRTWTSLIESNPVFIECEIYRKREGLDFLPIKIYLRYRLTDDVPQQDDHDDWDDGLNQFLIAKGIHAISEENEGIRFNLMLSRRLQNIEIRYGEGYFNAVFLVVIESGFGANAEIASMLKIVGPGNPHKGTSYPDVLSSIEGAIKMCADCLVKELKYPRDAAQRILIETVKQYMDERFSITNARFLGFI